MESKHGFSACHRNSIVLLLRELLKHKRIFMRRILKEVALKGEDLTNFSWEFLKGNLFRLTLVLLLVEIT